MSALRVALAVPFRVATFVLALIGAVFVVISIGFAMAGDGVEG